MRQHQKIFQEMLKENEELFGNFRKLNDQYAINPETVKSEFNRVGETVVSIIRKYEDRLCRSTENSQYNKFSSQLSEKFWNDVRVLFPKIDFVGVE